MFMQPKGKKKTTRPPDYKEAVDVFARYVQSVTDLDSSAAELEAHYALRARLDMLYGKDAYASSPYRAWDH